MATPHRRCWWFTCTLLVLLFTCTPLVLLLTSLETNLEQTYPELD